MKVAITLLALFFSFAVYSQVSRSFYTTPAPKYTHSTVLSDGVSDLFVSLKESTEDTLRIVSANISPEGETSQYKSLTILLSGSKNQQLTGAGLDQNGNMILAILYQNLYDAYMLYIKTDGITVLQQVILPDTLKIGFTRSIFTADSVITYVAKSPGGLTRISTSLVDMSITAEEVVDASITYVGAMASNKKKGELITNNNEEYFITGTHLIKRASAGSYQSVNLPVLTNNPFAMTFNTTNQLAVFYGSDYFLLDANLTTILSGSLGLFPNVFLGEEVFFDNGNYYLYTSSSNKPYRYVLTDAFTILESDLIPYQEFVPFGTKKLNGLNYIFGQKREYNEFYVTIDGSFNNFIPMSLFLIKEENGIREKFTEFHTYLHHNKFNYNVGHMGMLLAPGPISNNEPSITINDNGSNKSLLFASFNNFQGNNVQGTQINYYPKLQPGPQTYVNDYSYEEMDQYNRGYVVSRTMIEDHLTATGTNLAGYQIPFGIKHWPAHGEASKGQAINLAPFVDRNLNGIYDPENGDYPKILGDTCVLNIFHQSPNSPNSTQIEVLQYVYSFFCDTSELLQSSIFVRQDFICRNNSLDSVYVSSFNDFDLGNAYDDYSGSNVDLGIVYSYNGDAYDEDNLFGGTGLYGFHDSIPAFGMQILSGVKAKTDGLDNNFGPFANESSNGTGFGDGIIDNEIYNLSSAWSFGASAFTSGVLLTNYYVNRGLNGLGLPQTNGFGIDIKHAYYGKTDVLFYSSGGVNHGNNLSEELFSNLPGDRFSIASSGPGEMVVNDTVRFETAYIFGLDSSNSQFSKFKLFALAAELKNAYRNNSIDCGNNFDPYISTNTSGLTEANGNYLKVYPNPSSSIINIEGLIGNSVIRIVDANGKIHIERSFNVNASIDVSDLENAIYFLMIEDERTSQVYRIIKN